MKRSQVYFVQKSVARAINAALLTMLISPVAQAQVDPLVAELTTRTNEVELGVIDVSKKSFKFGEYNGLSGKGAHAAAGFNVGGKGDDNSTMFWSAEGTNLGLDSRRLEAQGGQQGTFKFNFVYDELPHKISDSYRTIFNGAGTTALTLPASYPAAATRLTATGTANQSLGNWNNIQAPNSGQGGVADLGGPGYIIPALMHNEDIGFKRTKIEGGFSFAFLPGWEAKFVARQDNKDGTKLTGYAFASASTAAMLVEPIKFKTNGFDLSLGYIGEQANFNAAYAYSVFKNDVGAWTTATPFAGASVLNSQALLSSAPENKMHQLKLAGGYRFAPTTRLAYELSTSRTTQDTAFNCQTATGVMCVNGSNSWIIPVASPNAKVANDTVFVKLSARPANNLALNGAFKYDRRDNQTPVNAFRVNWVDATAAASNSITNDPINVTKKLLTLDADYAVARAQAVKLGYRVERIDRTTDGSGFAPSRTSTTANANDFSIPVQKNKEDVWNIEYRNSMLAGTTGRISYEQSKRRALDYSTMVLTDTTDANRVTNAYYRSVRDYFVADRKRDKVRGAVNYQASEAWALGASLDHNRDRYTDAAFKESKSTIYNFDLSYTPSEDLTINSFLSVEDRKSSLTGIYAVSSTTAGAKLNGVAVLNSAGTGCNVSACLLSNWAWGMDQADKVNTLGFGAKYKASGKLDLNGDLVFIRARTPVTASGGGSLISDGAAAPNYVSVAAASYPEITSNTVQLRLTGNYKLDKSQTVRIAYMYQRLSSNDWQTDAYTNPIAMQSFIGTGQTAPNHTVNVIGASYLYNFK